MVQVTHLRDGVPFRGTLDKLKELAHVNLMRLKKRPSGKSHTWVIATLSTSTSWG